MKRIFRTIPFAFALSLAAASGDAADYYVAVGGSGSTCSLAAPCSLQFALGNQAVFGPGDTIYLRGGTYTGKFTSTLDGGTVLSYPGEWAVLDGYRTTTLSASLTSASGTATVASTAGIFPANVLVIDGEDMQVAAVVNATTLSVVRGWSGTTAAAHSSGASVYVKSAGNFTVDGGDNTTYRDFEVRDSNPYRDLRAARAGTARGAGVTMIGAADGNRLVHLVLHDNSNGIFVGSSTSNTTVYGCISYNNGVIDEGGELNGMGIYAENAGGYSRVYRSIFVNNWNFNAQFGGDGAGYVGGDHQGNVFANPRGTRNYLGRAEGAALSVTGNYFFQPHDRATGSVSLFGYGGIASLTLNNNYFVGGPFSMDLQNVTAISGGGNNFYLDSTTPARGQLFYNPTTIPTGTFNNNTYHKALGRDHFAKQGFGYYQISQWRTDSGFDAASAVTAVDMPDTVAVVASAEQTGRAHVVAYTRTNPTAINVDLSASGLGNGQAYTIRNAFDYLGAAVLTGTYNAASPTVSVPLTGAARDVAAPIGDTAGPTMCPDFCAFVVVPSAAAGAPAATAVIGGSGRLGGGVRLQ